jgi:hypothetical protein
MKKIILTILFVLLAVLALYFTFYRNGTTLNKSEKLFALNNPKETDRINISNSHENITLVRVNNHWSIDNREIRQDLINTLLGVSEGLDAISPVSHDQYDSILKKLDNGIIIKFYHKNRIIKALKICKSNNSIYGILDNSKNPYRLSLRGFPDIDLTKIYSASKEHWMINILFDFDPSNIKSIHLEYSIKPERGFQIEKMNDGQLYLSKNGHFSPLQNTDPEILTEYLGFYNDIKYYQLDDSTKIKIELDEKQKPLFHLKLNGVNDTITEIWGYNKPKTESDSTDPYEFYAKCREKGIILLKYNDFDPILVDLDYFLKK